MTETDSRLRMFDQMLVYMRKTHISDPNDVVALSAQENDKVLRILRSMGPISLSRLVDRIRLQKLGYLAQELGAGGSYPYSWYIYGPYSPKLTAALYSGVESGRFDSAPDLVQDESGVVSRMKRLLGGEIPGHRTLELFASIWYMLPAGKESEMDKGHILSIMREEKPHFEPAEVESALDKIIDFRKAP